jgi:hypothetical protein
MFVARPSKYTPEVASRITDALTAGNTRSASAQSAGVSEDSLERWMKRYAGFAASVLRAEAAAEVEHVANLAQAARAGSIMASIFWLERRRYRDWGKVDRLEIEVRTVAERVAQQTGADPDWLVKRAAEIAAEAQLPRGERS